MSQTTINTLQSNSSIILQGTSILNRTPTIPNAYVEKGEDQGTITYWDADYPGGGAYLPIGDSILWVSGTSTLVFGENVKLQCERLIVPDGGYIYFGDPTLSGTRRLGIVTGDLVVQQYNGSSWVTVVTIDA